MNPLLSTHGPIPFDEITAAHIEPAVEQRLQAARAQIDAIGSANSTTTYSNTFEALENATRGVDVTMTWIGLLEALLDDPKLREAYNAVQPQVAAFYATIPHDAALWSRLKAFAATDERSQLDPVRSRFVEETIKDFRRHGADLSSENKQTLAQIDIQLAQETNRFGQNVVDDTDDYELVITDENRLAGLPQSAISAARKSAESKGLTGWRFTLQGPSITAILTHLDDRSTREAVYKRYNTRATRGDTDNRERLETILSLRKQKAQLLGYADVSDLYLDGRMVRNGAAAQKFVDDLCTKTKRAALEEHESLAQFSMENCDVTHSLQPWDLAYYSEKQRRALYDFDQEEVRPYLSVPSVLDGLFELADRLFGVRAEPAEHPTWHADVQTFELKNATGDTLGVFYLDIFPREGKRGGAWMCPLRTGEYGNAQDPHYGMIGANFTPPGENGIALLKHREVETLFHEFGHLLHHLLTSVPVPSLAGTNVAWDFVELPSQIMENWCWERESLQLFARHHETHEVIPDGLMERMRSARNYRAGYLMMRQLSFGSVDLKLHRDYDPAHDGSVVAYAHRVADDFSPVPLPDEYSMITSFNHLFSSPVGYAAAYYSYKWAEVLEADAFTRFKKEGLFSAEVGGELRDKILSRGNSEDPMQLFKDFMGREPDPQALLSRAGLNG